MDWIDKLDGNVIVCDVSGTIIYMNEKAIKNYKQEGGASLVGRNIIDCHKEASRMKISEIMKTRQKNVYTIEKNGLKKIVYQAPWVDGDNLKGIIEFSLEIPFKMPHYKRPCTNQ